MGLKPFFLIVILFTASAALAQPAGLVEVRHRGILATQPFGCFLESGLYDDSKLKAAMLKPNCADKLNLGVDPQKESLVYYRVSSDCHMQVAVKVFRLAAEKKYKVIINNIYGGCRAGGTRAGWVVFEKLPPGYNVDMAVVTVDRIHGPIRDEGFAFPKPPSTVNRETLIATEIDLKGCLPLTGQSQWVIQHDSHLKNALAFEKDADRCVEVFKALAIDFSKYTLAGYSFASGHCGRPPNLGFQLVKETSSEQRENRYLVTATFDDAGENYCKVWTTYPVWMLVPKLPDGYGVSFETRARS